MSTFLDWRKCHPKTNKKIKRADQILPEVYGTTLNYLFSTFFDSESNWWRLFKIRLVHTKLDFFLFITNCLRQIHKTNWNSFILSLAYLNNKHKFNTIWCSSILELNVSDKGVLKNASCALNLISTFQISKSQLHHGL
jgi:hypothetical protein